MRKLNIGIVGAGRIGKLHAENMISMKNINIKSISDIFMDNIFQWAKGLGIEKITDDYNDIMNDPDIEAVFVCSSTDSHIGIIEEAAKKKKHIFCEKPISFNFDETRRIMDLVTRSGVKFQTGFNRRFDHNFSRVRDLIDGGSIGTPHVIKITSRDPEPPPAEYIKVSGGIFIDMSIHDFDMARFLSGSDVEEVYVQGAVLVDKVFQQFNDIDTAVITLKFKNGAIGVIDNSRKAVYGYDQRVEVFGADGCINIENDFDNTAVVLNAKGIQKGNPKYFFLERYKDAYIKEVREFVECVIHDHEVPVSVNDGFQAELIAHAAKRSLEEKRPVKLTEILKQDQFKD